MRLLTFNRSFIHSLSHSSNTSHSLTQLQSVICSFAKHVVRTAAGNTQEQVFPSHMPGLGCRVKGLRDYGLTVLGRAWI